MIDAGDIARLRTKIRRGACLELCGAPGCRNQCSRDLYIGRGKIDGQRWRKSHAKSPRGHEDCAGTSPTRTYRRKTLAPVLCPLAQIQWNRRLVVTGIYFRTTPAKTLILEPWTLFSQTVLAKRARHSAVCRYRCLRWLVWNASVAPRNGSHGFLSIVVSSYITPRGYICSPDSFETR